MLTCAEYFPINRTLAGYHQAPEPDLLNRPLIERFATAWRCTICAKMCSSKKVAQAHLQEAHRVTKCKQF